MIIRNGMFILPNRDFVSSEMYVKNWNKYNYDSFIFGSSRTIAFRTASWEKYLPDSASPFVFDAAGESIFGMYTKIVYLDKTGSEINNCLMIICTDYTFSSESNRQGHLFIKDPRIANTSWINFYTVFIKDYLDFRFLKSYFRFLFTGKYISSMKGYIENRKIIYDTVTNDVRIVDQENELNTNGKEYYRKRKGVFYGRDSIVPPLAPQILKDQVLMLRDIRSIFSKHHTNYKIIISPLYDQAELNDKDILTLQQVFGKDHVFNFSGKNEFTSNKEHYYESSHYRPVVGDSILNIIYR